MPTRRKFFLLDAGPLIELHRLGIWEWAVRRAELVIPSIVVEQEAEFWDSEDGERKPIRLEPLIKQGKIRKAEADNEQMRDTAALFDPSLVDSVDPGELEALSILRSWEGSERPSFCTGDRLATIALCLLGFSSLAVSLEELLQRVGLTARPRPQFCQDKMRRWVWEGGQRFITREGLR